MKLTFLGTGTSVGVPTIGCMCKVCKSEDIHDKRLRTFAMIETDSLRILIDCGPDFRQQMLDRKFRKIDAVLLTHLHYDHVGGLDDLRPFCRFGEVNVYADEATSQGLMHTMPYCFDEYGYPGTPRINLNVINPHETLFVGDNIRIIPVKVMHGKIPILGYRIGDLLYVTDMKTMDDDEFRYFRGVRFLVVNALRFRPDHHSHQTVDEAVAFAKKIGAEYTYFTHVCHDIGLHEEVNRVLPDTMRLAYDGLTVHICKNST